MAGRYLWRPASLLLLAGLLLPASACKRDADAPLPKGALFPEPHKTSTSPPSKGRGVLERAVLVTEVEPNDAREQAQVLADNALIEGTFRVEAHSDKADAGRRGKRRKRPRRRRIDSDWYRLPQNATPGTISRIELRQAPKCARLELWSVAGKGTRLMHAMPERRQRPVLDAVRRSEGDLLLRVLCFARQAPDPADRHYKLAISTRNQRLDEETEPNDVATPQTGLVPLGQGVQGTLGHRRDVDVFRLDLNAAPPGEALVLGVTGVPGVKLAVTLYDESGERVLLERKPPRGAGVLVPNLDVRRTGKLPVLKIATLSGIGPDAPYAASIRPLLPVGCPAQAACPERVPIEREPDDVVQQAMGITHGSLITGVIDSPGDVDWYAIDGEPGQVASVTLTAPAGLALTLAVADGSQTWAEVAASEPGQRLIFAGWLLAKRRFHVRVAGVGDAFDRGQSYLLRVRVNQQAWFERERGPDAALEPMARTGFGTWQRQGALLPAGDVDRFQLDLRARPMPTEATLRCAGDGAPGLWCEVMGPDGQSVARLQAPAEEGQESRRPIKLAPALWTVKVQAKPARMAPSTWRVEVADSRALDEALALPADLTPTLAPVPGDEPLPQP